MEYINICAVVINASIANSALRYRERCCIWMKMNFDEIKAEIRKNIDELKEDIKILNKNISEFENALEKVNSFDEMEQYREMDIEKGLKHIEIF